jgi:hypothetical protein
VKSFISAPAAHAVGVSFSDGSHIDVLALSQLRIDDSTATGARVHLERGRIEVQAVHRSHSSWIFLAGPYEVQVTGTKFELSWDPTAEAVSLRLIEGSVKVRSPLLETAISVRAGQHFTGDRQNTSFTVDESGSNAAPPDSAPSAAVIAPSATAMHGVPEVPSESAPSPSAKAPPSESWSKLVAAGRYGDVLEQATTAGIAGCLSTCSPQDVRALSDAARFKGRSELAERSLLALRQRFAGTGDGRTAAFYLGRLSESRGAMAAAERWYGVYTGEAPSGQYAAEALAGSMRAVKASRGAAAARPLAEQYLKRYPEGVEIKTARRIMEGG